MGGLYKHSLGAFTSASFKVSLDLRRRTWADSPVNRFALLEPVPAGGDPDAVIIERLKKEFKK